MNSCEHVAGLPTTQSWQKSGFSHSESFGEEGGEEGQKARIPACPAALCRRPGRSGSLDRAPSQAVLPTGAPHAVLPTQCSHEQAATRLHAHTSFPRCGPGTEPQAHVTVLLRQKQKIPFSVLINKEIRSSGRSAIGERGLAGAPRPAGNAVWFTLFSPVEMCSFH